LRHWGMDKLLFIFINNNFQKSCVSVFSICNQIRSGLIFVLTVSNITNVSWTVKGFFQQFFRSWSAEVFPFLRGTPSGAWLIFNFNELNIKKFCSTVKGKFEFFSFYFKIAASFFSWAIFLLAAKRA